MKTTVAHWNDRPEDRSRWVYIGRPSMFGNPFWRGGRDQRIDQYRRYFYYRLADEPAFRAEVDALAGLVLVCHCKPLDCHGDVIAEYLNRRDP